MAAAESGTAQVITNGSMTGVAVLRSLASNVRGLKFCSYFIEWTGTPTGTFAFFGSNLPANADGSAPDTSVDANWTQLTLGTAPTNPAGAAARTGLDLNEFGFLWVHMRYTNSASTGTLNAYFHGKG